MLKILMNYYDSFITVPIMLDEAFEYLEERKVRKPDQQYVLFQ